MVVSFNFTIEREKSLLHPSNMDAYIKYENGVLAPKVWAQNYSIQYLDLEMSKLITRYHLDIKIGPPGHIPCLKASLNPPALLVVLGRDHRFLLEQDWAQCLGEFVEGAVQAGYPASVPFDQPRQNVYLPSRIPGYKSFLPLVYVPKRWARKYTRAEVKTYISTPIARSHVSNDWNKVFGIELDPPGYLYRAGSEYWFLTLADYQHTTHLEHHVDQDGAPALDTVSESSDSEDSGSDSEEWDSSDQGTHSESDESMDLNSIHSSRSIDSSDSEEELEPASPPTPMELDDPEADDEDDEELLAIAAGSSPESPPSEDRGSPLLDSPESPPPEDRGSFSSASPPSPSPEDMGLLLLRSLQHPTAADRGSPLVDSPESPSPEDRGSPVPIVLPMCSVSPVLLVPPVLPVNPEPPRMSSPTPTSSGVRVDDVRPGGTFEERLELWKRELNSLYQLQIDRDEQIAERDADRTREMHLLARQLLDDVGHRRYLDLISEVQWDE